MYNLSAISHVVLQRLKQRHTSTTPTRSQILELMAAYLGYKTYASFKADSTISKEQLKAATADQAAAFTRLDGRLEDLNIQISFASQLKQSVIEYLNVDALCSKFSLLKIAQYLSVAVGRVNLQASEVEAYYEYLSTCHDAESALLRYVWHCHQGHQDFDDRSCPEASSYWHQQREAGVKLSAVANEWANAYEQHLVATHNRRILFSAESCTQLARPLVTEVIHGQCAPNLCWQLNAKDLLVLFEGNMIDSITDEFLDDWLHLDALQNPDHYRLVTLTESLATDVEIWACYLFGLNQQIDITADNYSLINSYTGEEWDECGPAVAVGYAGIALPIISENQARESHLLAEHMQTLQSLVQLPAKNTK